MKEIFDIRVKVGAWSGDYSMGQGKLPEAEPLDAISGYPVKPILEYPMTALC